MSAKHIPYFSFYPADFMNGVRGLTPQEVGVYTMLLCRIYEESGPVEMNIMRLSTYCGMREKTFAAVLDKLIALGKFQVADGHIINPRAAKEIQKRADGLKIASKAGKASAEKKQQKQRSDATPVERPFNHTDTDTDKSIPEANASGREASPAEPDEDFSKQLFDRAVAFLGRHGVLERHARGIVGKWRRDHTDAAILDAFTACSRAGAIDPVPWIAARLGASERASASVIPLDRVAAAALANLQAEAERKAASR